MPDTQTSTPTWDRGSINRLLLRNAKAVERALVVLYDLQTRDEQQKLATTDANKQGFGYYDAEVFSSFAMWVKRGRSLSEKQLAVCRKLDKYGNPRIGKYWRQLQAMCDPAKPPRAELIGAVEMVSEAIEQVPHGSIPVHAPPPLDGAFAGGAW